MEGRGRREERKERRTVWKEESRKGDGEGKPYFAWYMLYVLCVIYGTQLVPYLHRTLELRKWAPVVVSSVKK
jgi:hypothetical protein